MSMSGYLEAYVTAFLKAKLRAYYSSKDLKFIHIDNGLSSARHVVIAVVRNEASRLQFFLRYYRDLGFNQFIIIDNCSTDDTLDMLRNEPGLTLISSKGSYKKSRFGMDWVNFIAGKYCRNTWLLNVDADEFLVLPSRFSQNITELTVNMERLGQYSLQCTMIDMYSKSAASENYCARGEDPLTICNFFDGSGYNVSYNEITQTTWIKGGVRARLFFNDIKDAPALNKTPLVFWRWHYAFLKSAHEAWPPQINGGRDPAKTRIGGALLHFKFLADFESKVNEELERRQHTQEYANYRTDCSSHIQSTLSCEITEQYVSFESLERRGLVPPLWS